MRLITQFLSMLFFAGMAGSAIVILLTFYEDFRDIFSDDDKKIVEKSEQEQRHALGFE